MTAETILYGHLSRRTAAATGDLLATLCAPQARDRQIAADFLGLEAGFISDVYGGCGTDRWAVGGSASLPYEWYQGLGLASGARRTGEIGSEELIAVNALSNYRDFNEAGKAKVFAGLDLRSFEGTFSKSSPQTVQSQVLSDDVRTLAIWDDDAEWTVPIEHLAACAQLTARHSDGIIRSEWRLLVNPGRLDQRLYDAQALVLLGTETQAMLRGDDHLPRLASLVVLDRLD